MVDESFLQSQSVQKSPLTKEIQENQDSEYLPTKGRQFRHDKGHKQICVIEKHVQYT